MNTRRIAVIVLLLGAAIGLYPSRAKADSIEYTFSGTNTGIVGADGLSVALQWISPAYITSLTDVSASQLISCTNCLVSSTIPAVEFRPNDPGGPAIGFVDVNQIEFFYRFAPGAFTNVGTYTSLSTGYPGTLAVSVVPEPKTLTLLLIGCLTLLGAAWQRARTQGAE